MRISTYLSCALTLDSDSWESVQLKKDLTCCSDPTAWNEKENCLSKHWNAYASLILSRENKSKNYLKPYQDTASSTCLQCQFLNRNMISHNISFNTNDFNFSSYNYNSSRHIQEEDSYIPSPLIAISVSVAIVAVILGIGIAIGIRNRRRRQITGMSCTDSRNPILDRGR